MEIFEEVKSFLADEGNKDTSLITPFPLLTENAVESLRYRAEVNDLILSFTTRNHWKLKDDFHNFYVVNEKTTNKR